MRLWEIVFITFGLTLDTFAFCLYKGAMVSWIDKKNVARLAALFTVFQVCALLLGSLTRYISWVGAYRTTASAFWLAISAALFFGLGIWMLFRSLRRRNETVVERKEDDYNFRVYVIWALLTSVDALIAGIGFTLLSVDLMILVIVLTVTTLLSVCAGIFWGYRLGCASRNKFRIVGSCFVLAGGADVLLRFLEMLD